MYRAALQIANQLGVSVPIIAYNGALIKSSAGEILHEKFLDSAVALELINFFAQRDLHLQSYVEDILYVPEHNRHTKFYEDSQKVTAKAVGWDGMRQRVVGITKLLSIAEPEEIPAIMSDVKKIFGGQAEITRSAPRFAEFMAPGVTKAGAIKILAEKFGVDNSEILAIGDSDNDLQMLKSVGLGVAMGNAVPAVLAACKIVTDTCENDGLAKAVYDYVL